MGRIVDNTFKDWKDNDLVRSADYKREREIIRAAVNDNFDRLMQKYDKSEVDNLLNVIKGNGWTIETIKGNHDLIKDILETHYPADVVDVKLTDLTEQMNETDTLLQEQINDNKTDIDTLQVNSATKNELNSQVQQLQGQINSNDSDIHDHEMRLFAAEDDLRDRYTKQETNFKVDNVQTQINNLNNLYSTDAERIQAISDVIEQFEIADGDLEQLINNKADKSNTYTKAEVDFSLSNKINSSDVHTRESVNNLLSYKTDKTGNHDGTWKGLLPSDIGAGEMNASRITYLEEQAGNQERNTQTLQHGPNVLEGEVNAPATFQLEGKTLTSLGNSDLEDAKYYILADKRTKVKTFKEDTWKQGVAKFQRQQSLTSTADFTGKVSGSFTENPHLAYSLNSPTLVSPTLTPVYENTNNIYSNINKLDGTVFEGATSTQNGIRQQFYSFNIIEQIERKHGMIPAVDKVQWVKENVNKLTCNWWGYGSGASGNMVTLSYWIQSTSSWSTIISHTNSLITKLSVVDDNGLSANLDSSGFTHFLAYAPASDGVAPSVIHTDYISLDVELKTTAQLIKRPIFSRIATFEGKVSGSTVENPHVAKYEWSPPSNTLVVPSGFSIEFTEGSTARYSRSNKLDDNVSYVSRTVDGFIAQQLFSINIVEEIERKLGKIPKSTLADKVQWCKDNLSLLDFNWYGQGTSPLGNKATLTNWNFNGGAWHSTGVSSISSTIKRLTRRFSDYLNIAATIGDDGWSHMLAYAEPSDGVTASMISTDYFECEIELKPGAELWHPSVPLYEVTQSEYDKALVDWTEGDVLARYPRVEGSQSIQNPYVMAEGDNLLPPFHEWNLHANATVKSPYELELNATGTWSTGLLVYLNARPNTQYTLSFDMTNHHLVYSVNAAGVETAIFTAVPGTKTFVTPSDTVKILVRLTNSTIGTFTFKNPMLTLGSTPKPFVPRNPSYLFAETKLGSIGDKKDLLYSQDDSYVKRKVIEEVVLDGSLGWTYGSTESNTKQVRLPSGLVGKNVSNFIDLVKFNGKELGAIISYNEFKSSPVDNFYVDLSDTLFMTLLNTDTGWSSHTPSTSDIKRYFNGWKYTDGTTWQSVTGNGETADATTSLSSKPTGYMPYKLSYVLAIPKMEQVKTEGAITVNGKTHVEVGSGVVVREKANPKYASLGGKDYYVINYVGGYTAGVNKLNQRVGEIMKIFKDNKPDNSWSKVNNPSISYGSQYANIFSADFDTEAEYTVTYLVLDKHLFTSNPNDVKATYSRNLRDAHDDLAKRYEDTATKVSVLDRTVYELLVWKLKHESEGGA
jgi:hypothetical protein